MRKVKSDMSGPPVIVHKQLGLSGVNAMVIKCSSFRRCVGKVEKQSYQPMADQVIHCHRLRFSDPFPPYLFW